MTSVSGARRAGRAALTIGAWNAVSRVTGFLRVLAVGGALGTTFLGNTYQSANLVSNLLFELLAAGLLSAPLVPVFVPLLAAGRTAEVERLAGALLGLALAVLGAVVLVLAVNGHAVMRLLTATVDDPAVRAREVRLGAFLLWFFLPQVLLYATGAVASALLHARSRFAAAAFAPVANNLVVIATMLAFIAMRAGRPPSLSLAPGERLLLAAGTTAGVLAMSAVPVVALRRAGLRLRLSLDARNPHLRSVARLGVWGGVLLATVQALLAVTLVLANRVEGGVVAYQIAFTFFLLPFALVAHPLFTALYPRLAAAAAEASWRSFADDVSTALARMALLLLPAAAVLAATAGPVLGLVRLGALGVDGAGLVARVLAAYAPGLAGYSAFHLLARASTATGDARLPALVGAGVAAGGAALMVAGFVTVRGDDRVVVLGLAHSAAVTAGALARALRVRPRRAPPLLPGAAVVRATAAAAAAWVAARTAAAPFGGGGRLGEAVALLAGGTAGLAAAVAVLWLLRTPELRGVVRRA